MPKTDEELFSRIIQNSLPMITKIWEEGIQNFPELSLNCPNEVNSITNVGEGYFQCQPHFWQCYWEGGVKRDSSLTIKYLDKKYHVKASPVFEPITEFSNSKRFYKREKIISEGIKIKSALIVELVVEEIPGFSQRLALFDTCRDVYLPQRVYLYGNKSGQKKETWNNLHRKIFIDKFYVSNQQVNEWRILSSQRDKIILDKNLWHRPALLNLDEQIKYCSFWGKRVLEAKLLDAASMTPTEINNPSSEATLRPQTFWQRDIGKTFLGTARINPDFELTPLDCQLVEVKGCEEQFFKSDSASWMGVNYSLGFYPESLMNMFEPDQNLKLSSKFLPPSSEFHEIGKRTYWDGYQKEQLPVAFRCYEEVVE